MRYVSFTATIAKSPLKSVLPILPTDPVVNENSLYLTDQRSDHRVVNNHDIDVSMNKPAYNSPTLVNLICIQKQGAFSHTGAAQ